MKQEFERVIQSSLVNKFVATLGRSIEYGRWEFQYRKYREEYEVHPTFNFAGPGTILYGDGRIVLGERSSINRYGSLSSLTGCELVIGKNCAIGPYVLMSTANKSANQDFSKTKMMVTRDVRIDDDCWIGAGVFINQGVSIGNNSVIGANSVVTRDIPPHSIAAGAPAKVIRFKPYLGEMKILEFTDRYWHSLSFALKRESVQRYPELKSLKLRKDSLLQRTL